MKLALRLGSRVVTVILGIIMFITMYAAISSRISGGTPSVMGLNAYEVLSGSMEPKIHTGSVIMVSPHANAKSLKVGDVITFNVPHEQGVVVTHRIVNISSQDGQPVFETKGDANPTKDTWQIPANSVIGKYSSITIPYLGYYLNFLKTKLGISLLLIVPGALLIITTIVSLFREIGKLQKSEATKTVSAVSTDSNEVKV